MTKKLDFPAKNFSRPKLETFDGRILKIKHLSTLLSIFFLFTMRSVEDSPYTEEIQTLIEVTPSLEEILVKTLHQSLIQSQAKILNTFVKKLVNLNKRLTAASKPVKVVPPKRKKRVTPKPKKHVDDDEPAFDPNTYDGPPPVVSCPC
jgi:penicillin-binding protein-related factor A (putative recombinase)